MAHAIYPYLLPAALFLTAGCSSTDVVPAADPASSLVTLNVSAPGAYIFGAESRADDSYKLRLVAALYPSPASEAVFPIETRELIYNPAGTILSFEIAESGNYLVTVFADYLPVATTADGSGHFADYYYDTASQPGTVTVKGDKTDFFNNEMRQCFAGKIAFEKGTATLTKDLTLRRPVSRIEISAPGDNVETLVSRVDVTRCSHLDRYCFTLDGSEITGSVASADASAAAPKDITIANVQSALAPDGKKLLFYYTFAGFASDEARPALGEIAFTLVPMEGVALQGNASRTLPSGLIKPAQNYRVSVKGADGWINADASGDDITIHLDVPQDWGSTEEI